MWTCTGGSLPTTFTTGSMLTVGVSESATRRSGKPMTNTATTAMAAIFISNQSMTGMAFCPEGKMSDRYDEPETRRRWLFIGCAAERDCLFVATGQERGA